MTDPGAGHAGAAVAAGGGWSWRLAILLVVSVLLFLCMNQIATRSLQTLRVEVDWLAQTEQVRYQLSRILQLLVDTQTGASSYALSGEDHMLDSYREAGPLLDTEILRLEQLVVDNPGQDARANRLGGLARELAQYDQELLQAARDGNTARARALLADPGAQQSMTEARSLIGRMQAEENRLLALRRASSDKTARDTTRWLWASGALGALLIILVVIFARRDDARVRRAERRDASERRMTERALREREAELQIVNDYARFPIARCDRQHRYLFVNRVYAERLGFTPEQCIGKHIREVAGERAYAVARPRIETALRGTVVEFEDSIPYSSGSSFMRCIYAPERDDQGRVRSFVAALIDITERKRAEDALRASEARFRAVQDTSIDGFMIFESVRDESGSITDFRWIYVNEASARMLRRPRSWFIGRSLLAERPHNRERLFDVYVRVVETGEPWSGESIAEYEGIESYFRVVAAKSEDGFACTFADMSERRRAELELRRTEAALRDADMRKDIFLATLSHELRNPLAPIRTAAEILGSAQTGPDQLKWAQKVIQRQVKHMALLLDDLLDIARITQGKLELKMRRIELAQVVDAAVEAARPLLEGRNHQLRVTLPPERVILHADPLRLSQVLSNLLTNAAKYTDPGGRIEVTAAAQGGTLTLSVKDDGMGIAPNSLTHIFEMFSQLEGNSTRSDGGLGIGLALVKGVIELHAGTIEARSDGPGRGSEFTFRIPIPADAADAIPDTGQAPAPVASKARRVLVADDNKDAADSLAMWLELAGHEVRVAHSGRAALSLAQAFRPDASLLDIGMPDLSGYEVAAELRREPWGSGILLVALTGWGQEDDRRRAREAGFDRHLTKPVDPEALGELLADVPPRRSVRPRSTPA